MSKSVHTKISAVLIGLTIVTTSAFPALAITPKEALDRAASQAAAKKELLQQRIETRKENLETRIVNIQEKLASREAALKAKLQTFRDQKKATVAARLSANLNMINQNRTNQMKRHLNVMSSILDKLEARIDRQAPDIKDPTAAKAAVTLARTNIATVSAAVEAQTQKDYTIQVTSEAKVRLDAKTQRDLLFKDLLSLRQAMIDTKQSVANAIRVTKSGYAPATSAGVIKEATISGR